MCCPGRDDFYRVHTYEKNGRKNWKSFLGSFYDISPKG